MRSHFKTCFVSNFCTKMEAVRYKIDIIHFVNPYLIWVVRKNAEELEQIGLFGILPVQVQLDPVQNELTMERSADWMPAAAVLMKKVFDDTAEVIFCVEHIDNRNSIFDDNIHKYGEIILKKGNGKYIFLSSLLVKHQFGIPDKEQFLEDLSSGKLKTVLTHPKIKEIMVELERKCKNQAKKQMTVYEEAENMKTLLTMKNLEKHNRRFYLKEIQDVDKEKVLEDNLQSLKLCKDIDSEGLGRASSRQKKVEEPTTHGLKKKLSLLKGIQKNTKDAIDYFKKLREDDFTTVSSGKVDSGTDPIQPVTDKQLFEDIPAESTHGNGSPVDFDAIKPPRDPTTGGCNTNLAKDCNKATGIVHKKRKQSHTSIKHPDFDPVREVLVACGPPDVPHQKLHPSVVPRCLPDEVLTKINEGVPEDISEVDSDMENQIKKNFASGKYDNDEDKTISTSSLNDLSVTQNINQGKCTDVVAEVYRDMGSKAGSEKNSIIKKKLKIHKDIAKNINSSTSDTSNKDTSSIDNERTSSNVLDSDDDDTDVVNKIKTEYKPIKVAIKEIVNKHSAMKPYVNTLANHVNPFQNVDPNFSVFVDKVTTPVLMVHSKLDKRFRPAQMTDVPFTPQIQSALKRMSVEKPMMIQSITWTAILRGYSLIMVSPKRSGKTLGYLPAVCRLVSDKDCPINGVGPTAIIVCATANSVAEVDRLAKGFLNAKDKVLAFYSGMDELEMTTSLLNGCDLLVCTPPVLVRLIQADFGVDLRRLTTFVIDDCERIAKVYATEVRFFLHSIKNMLKARVVKELKVQFVLASRIWCNFMEKLAKKAPDTAICIGAFQECVLYSKTNTTASFVTKEKKVDSVLEFFNQVDNSKRSVVVCRDDDEVAELEKALKAAKFVVFPCNSSMTVIDLYNLCGAWNEYQEPIIGPILLCCDANLIHLNVTNAHYLVHYSLPHLFSMFCKRFSVLNDNYASIFKENNEELKIKILLDDQNVEQLPKILHFIQRCRSEFPEILNEICQKVLVEKDVMKGKKLVPICDNLMALGECPDFWNCQDRHSIFKSLDEPADWVPKTGIITFKMLHYHTAVLYSGRLLTHTTNGETVKFPQNYNMLAMKISMYFSRESNRRPFGIPAVGDKCAVSINQNFFLRCQVVKILNHYPNGKPNYVLIKLIDEQRLEKTRDVYLFYLPDDMLKTETHGVQIRLANIQPKDKDIIFSNLARDQLRSITDNDEELYMRGQVALTIGNCIFVDTLETCRDLSTMNKTVVRHDFKAELLGKHGNINPDHLPKLETLCINSGLIVPKEPEVCQILSTVRPKLPEGQWAHLEKDDYSQIYFASAEDLNTFFVRLVKFDDSCKVLVKDIDRYVEKYIAESVNKSGFASEGDMVLAKLPDDGMFERARIDERSENNAKCFFVDQGDWRVVSIDDLVPITEKLITQLPYQAIECRLIGVKPPGENWTEFAINWFSNCFEDNSGGLKQIYAKYFTKEPSQYTGGHKYGVVLVDTNSDKDIVINEAIVEVNLAKIEDSECEYVKQVRLIDFKASLTPVESDDEKWEKISKVSSNSEDDNVQKVSLNHILLGKPIRSVPLVDSDNESDDKWDIYMDEDLRAMFKPAAMQSEASEVKHTLPMLKHNSETDEEKSDEKTEIPSSTVSEPDSQAEKTSLTSDLQIVNEPSIKELDSDDFTSPEPTQLSGQDGKENKLLNAENDIKNGQILSETEKNTVILSEETKKDISQAKKVSETKKENAKETKTITKAKQITKPQDELRKPRVLWWQKKEIVTIKIQLIVNEYQIAISDSRNLMFSATANDTAYGFEIELYGVIKQDLSSHQNKGQYVLIKLVKLLDRTWLNLNKSGKVHKWITYDVDAIDIHSDDESDVMYSPELDMIKNMHDNVSESEEEEFFDDADFIYNK